MIVAVTLAFTFLAAVTHVRADPNPNSPGPGDVFIQGKLCTIGWDSDQTGLWKTMTIELMTGNNFDMVSLTPVGTVDGTDTSKTNYTYTCPQVTPHAPIYFYEFSSPSASHKMWTGRFTITDAAHDVVAPSELTQPGGAKIPWGTGSLVGASSFVVPAPAGASNTSLASSSTPISPSSSAPASSDVLDAAWAPSSTPVSPSLSAAPSNTSPSLVSVTISVFATPDSNFPVDANAAMAASFSHVLLWVARLALGLAASAFVVIF